MNSTVLIHLAKSYRTADLNRADEWRRTRVDAEPRPAASTDSTRRFSLTALRSLLSQHA